MTTEDTEDTEAVNHHMNAALEAVAEVARKLKEERDEAWAVIKALRVNAREDLAKLNRERDEARERAERYRLDANAMMMQRDDAREYVDRYRERLDLTPMSWEAAE